MAEVRRVWILCGVVSDSARDEELYTSRKPEITRDTNSKYCSIVEWVEQELPETDAGIRRLITNCGPCLPGEVIDSIAAKKAPAKEPKKLRVLCFADESGLCQGVLEAMDKHKTLATMKMVTVYGNASLDTEASIEALLSEGWDLLLFGCGVDPPESNDPDDVIAWSDKILKVYLRITKYILRKPKDVAKVCLLTSGTFSDEGAVHAEAGAGITVSAHLFGMTNTLRFELTSTPFHYIDADWTVDGALVAVIAREVARESGFGENTVRLTARGRFVARMVHVEPRYRSNVRFVTPASGVIGIGGGNGALGLVMGKYFIARLADPASATLTLMFLSRSAKVSGDENNKLWADIQKSVQGTNITVVQAVCDVSKRAAVEAFVSGHAAELAGFVHSAGILRDGLLVNQTEEMYDQVFGPKAWAGLYLHHALLKQPTPKLELLWMFSSISVYGNMGQSNYSGANSLLDCLARHRKALGMPCTTMQWSAWGEVGMAAQQDAVVKARWEASPFPLFTNAQGIAGMDQGLSTGLPYFCVLRLNTESLFNQQNKEMKTPNDRYLAKFWSHVAPSQSLTELDLYNNVRANYFEPQHLIYDHFISGDAVDEEQQHGAFLKKTVDTAAE